MKIIESKKSGLESYFKIFGLTVYSEKNINGTIIKKKLFGIYKTKKVSVVTKYYIFGIRYKKTEDLASKITYSVTKNVKRLITTAALHQRTFLPFKNKNMNQSVVLIGAGPTVNNYIPIKNALHLGLNRAFKLENVNFDYLFATNKTGIEDFMDEFINYSGNNCVKFIGDESGNPKWQISESLLLKTNAHRFINTSLFPVKEFSLFIDSEPLHASSTVSIQAMQFLLYTNPKKIYLVGIDCSVATQGHFIGGTSQTALKFENLAKNDNNAIQDWRRIKNFANCYYPDTEIISINPVGLKGIFKDIYTDKDGNYIDKFGQPVEINNKEETLCI